MALMAKRQRAQRSLPPPTDHYQVSHSNTDSNSISPVISAATLLTMTLTLNLTPIRLEISGCSTLSQALRCQQLVLSAPVGHAEPALARCTFLALEERINL